MSSRVAITQDRNNIRSAIETGLVIASTEALAADVVGARLLGDNPQGVRHLCEAERLGLGETDTDDKEFPALSLTEVIEPFTGIAHGQRLKFEHTQA